MAAGLFYGFWLEQQRENVRIEKQQRDVWMRLQAQLDAYDAELKFWPSR